jgi:hypothetical protein
MEQFLIICGIITVVILIPLELYIRYKKGKKDE